MADKEKIYFVNGGKFTKFEMVCKGLHQCTMPLEDDGYDTQCSDCPYFDPDCTVADCKNRLCEDTIALLKEQKKQIEMLAGMYPEPEDQPCPPMPKSEDVKPIKYFTHYDKAFGLCPWCNRVNQRFVQAIEISFCPHCGKKVKWE